MARMLPAASEGVEEANVLDLPKIHLALQSSLGTSVLQIANPHWESGSAVYDAHILCCACAPLLARTPT